MKPRNLFATIVGPLLFANASGSLPTGLAQNAAPTFEPKAVASEIGTIDLVTNTPNLLGYWRFDPGFQTKSWVNGYTGTLQGNAQIGPPNSGCPLASDPANQGLLLDGANSYLTTSLTGPIVNQGTILAWVYLTAQPSTVGHIFEITAQSQFGNDFDLQIETDDHVHFCTDSGSATVSPQALPLNDWHFLAATFIANSIRSIYLDGQLVARSIAGPHYPNHNPFWIGNNQMFGPRLFQGRIDEVAIFNRALTASEIAGIASPAQRPTLNLATLNNAVMLTWPTNFTGYKLQSSATLNPAHWATLTNNYSVISNNFSITHPLFSPQMFFRLLPELADSAAPANEAKTDSAAVGTNFPGHVLARANANPVPLLANALDNQRWSMDVIANNLANINTTGFKAGQLGFQDKSRDEEGRTAFLNGAEPVYVQRLFTQGELRQTGNRLDLAIQGRGFFQIQMPDGTLAYTRDGSFVTDAQGRWVTRTGNPVMGLLPVPQEITSISISATGLVTYTNANVCTVLQAQLTGFANPEGLDALSANLFQETVASGTPERGNPGENGFGLIKQGFLECSNVSLEQEKAHMAQAQHVYETTLQAMQLAEKMRESDHFVEQ